MTVDGICRPPGGRVARRVGVLYTSRMLAQYTFRLLALVACLIAIGMGWVFHFVGPLLFFVLLTAVAGIACWLWKKR